MRRSIQWPAATLLVFTTILPAARALSNPSAPLKSPLGSAGALTDDGIWSVAPTLHDRSYLAAFVYDSARERLIVFGGLGTEIRYLNDTWAFSLAEDQWNPIAAAGTPPSGRYAGAAIYDPGRDRLIVFGGGSSLGLFNDLWQLSLSGTPTWTQLTPTGTPPSARLGSLAVYDPVRDRMVLFGGDSGALHNDVFALSLSGPPAWSQLSIGNAPPPARSYGGALYDPVRDRLVLFGGSSGGGASLSDTWELAFGTSTWNPIATSGTPPQGTTAIVYDPLRDGLLTYSTDSLWALNFTGTPTWQAVNTGTGPAPRYNQGLALDPVRDRAILFGGQVVLSSDTWQCPLNAPAWTMLDEGEPQISTSTSTLWAVHDSIRDRMIVMLRDGSSSRIMTLAFATHLWSTISPAGTPPSDRSGGSAIYDPAGEQVILFGGTTSTGRTNETWALQLSNSPQWVQLFPTGEPPAPRNWHGAILDTQGNRMIVAGGTTDAGAMNDVWSLNLSGTLAWTPLSPTGTPPTSIGSSVYDESGNRMIVTNNGSAVSILSLGDSPAWSSAPGNGTSYVLRPFYDGARHRVIGFELGLLYAGPRYWAFDLGSLTWTQLHPVGSAPGTAKDNYPYALVFDRRRDRLVHFGVISCTGLGYCRTENGTHQWSFEPAVVSVEPIPSNLARSALLSVEPSPARAAQQFAFRIAPDDVPRTLEIYSVEGRRVWHESLRARGPGIQSASWNGQTADGKRAPAAVYFARLVTARVTSTRRFVRL